MRAGSWKNDRVCFFFSSRRRHTRLQGDWSSDVCSSDLLCQIKVLRDISGHGVVLLRGPTPVEEGRTPTRNRRGSGPRPELQWHTAKSAAFQIGRASCRERV